MNVNENKVIRNMKHVSKKKFDEKSTTLNNISTQNANKETKDNSINKKNFNNTSLLRGNLPRAFNISNSLEEKTIKNKINQYKVNLQTEINKTKISQSPYPRDNYEINKISDFQNKIKSEKNQKQILNEINDENNINNNKDLNYMDIDIVKKVDKNKNEKSEEIINKLKKDNNLLKVKVKDLSELKKKNLKAINDLENELNNKNVKIKQLETVNNDNNIMKENISNLENKYDKIMKDKKYVKK